MPTERRGGWPGRYWHEPDWMEVNMHRMKRLDEAKEKREAAMEASHEVLATRAKQEDADGDSQ